MSLVVRTWNLFHGNASPPRRRAYLREMVELVTADRPAVVCLQELPVWALSQLERWSGMRAVGAVARRPLLRSAELGRALTELHHGVLRSALTGEADAILVDASFAVAEERARVVSETGVLRRIAHGLRLDGRIYVVNFHASARPEELQRAAELADGEQQVIVAGDANLPAPRLPGFSEPLADSIDQIYVRGLPAAAPSAWPEERRRLRGILLSDHAPVELAVG